MAFSGKRPWGSIAALAAGAVGSAISTGLRAGRAISADSSLPVTWKGEMPMMKRRLPNRPRYGSRKNYLRRAVIPRPVYSSWRRVVRTGASFESSISAGTFVGAISNMTLNDVKVSDLITAYRLFRLRKVVVYFASKVDSANNGVTNNFVVRVSTACDPEGTTVPANVTDISAYDNSRDGYLTSGSVFKYTFYPKVVNTVDNGGAPSAAGSYSLNPWLQLNSTGAAIPHRQLVWGLTTTASTTVSVSRYFEYHFDVKGMA